MPSVPYRLAKHADYQRVYHESRKHFSASMTYFFAGRSHSQTGPRVGLTAGRKDIDELLGSEQRTAPAQVGPDAFLHARDGDDVPLKALCRVRGHQPNTFSAGRLRCQGVARDLLAEQVVEEHVRPGLRQPISKSGGDVEERDHCVKVAVSGRRTRTA